MDIMMTEVTDVVTRKVSKHGIIHGMDQYKNRAVKIVVFESATDPVSEKPYSELAPEVQEQSIIEDVPEVLEAEEVSPQYEKPTDTLSLMREFVSKD